MVSWQGTVHIGVVTYNCVEDLPLCLVSIQTQTYSPYTLTILDSASTDGTRSWLEDHTHDTLLLADHNIGFGRGHNHILRTLPLQVGDFYLAINPDVILQPNFVSQLVLAIRNTGAGQVTGKLLCRGNPELIYSAGHAMLRSGYGFNIGQGLRDNGEYSQMRPVFGACGAAVMMTHDFILDLAQDGSLFDEAMFLYGEDLDLDWRARRRRWDCWYVPEAVAFHRVGVPATAFRNMAIAHRYLSVIKNMDRVSLVSYNLPIIITHFLLRIVLTPRQGVNMVRLFLAHLPSMVRQRERDEVPREELKRWFQWSRSQTSKQPTTWFERIVFFFSSRHY